MSNHKRNFERWRKKLTTNGVYLVNQVIERVIPIFEEKGFVWYSDFAGGDSSQIATSEIPLQNRLGSTWSTVQIQFYVRRGLWFRVYFGALPEQCRRLKSNGFDWIPRENATVFEGPATFQLHRGRFSSPQDSEFGLCLYSVILSPSGWPRYIKYKYSPQSFLESEVDEFLMLLPMLFQFFEKGIPTEWLIHDRGLISPNAKLLFSWHLHDVAFSKMHEKAG